MKKKVFFSIMLIGLAFTMQAQSWFTPGTVYQFESKSTSNPQEVITLRVIYDAQGNATVAKSTRYAGSQDKQKTCSFGPPSELSISTNQGNPGTTVYTYTTKNKYWMIPFDTYTSAAMPSTETTITCTCTSNAESTCDVSTQTDSSGACSTCVPGTGCMTCKMTVSNSTFTNIGGVLIIKANNITLQ